MRNDPEISGGASWLDAVLYDGTDLPTIHILLEHADPAISENRPIESHGHAATMHG